MHHPLIVGTLAVPLALATFAQHGQAQACPRPFDLNSVGNSLGSWPTPTTNFDQPTSVGVPFNTRSYTVLGERAFFVAGEADFGREPFATDGTSAGTVRLGDLAPGPTDSHPRCFKAGANEAYFVANDGASDRLYRTDGTPAGTVPFFGAEDVGVTFYHLVGDGLVFWGTSSQGTGLHQVDLQATAITLLVDDSVIPELEGTQHAEAFFGDRKRVYFNGRTASLEHQLWVTDGTLAGTLTLTDASSSPVDLADNGWIVHKDNFFFTRSTPGTGNELWRSDGTKAGTHGLKDINPGPQGSQPDLWNALDLGDRLLFRAYDAAHGAELWTTDGTAAGTQLAFEFVPGPQGINPTALLLFAGALHFTGSTPESGYELFRLEPDGSAALVTDIGPGAAHGVSGSSTGFVELGGKLYFASIGDEELWDFDGVNATEVVDLDPEGSSWPRNLTVLPNGRLIFAARHPSMREEVWVSDGTAAGTHVLLDINGPSEPAGSDPLVHGAALGDTFLFQAHSPTTGNEIWQWSAAGGAQLVFDFSLGPLEGSGGPLSTVWLGGEQVTLFSGDPDGTGKGLWKYDGSQVTELLDAANGGQSYVTGLVQAAGRVFFSPVNETGYTLWSTDGSLAGTQNVKLVGTDGANNLELGKLLGDKLVFVGKTGGKGVEPWVSDGTPAGTMNLADIHAGTGSSFPTELTPFVGRMAFVAREADGKSRLWSTDGTPAGTAPVGGAPAGIDVFSPEGLTVHEGWLYFSAAGFGGFELWRSDLVTTELVKDINPGGSGSNPKSLTSTAAGLVFSAETPGFGRELWVSDGTQAGTHLWWDVEPGPLGSDPSELIAAGGGVLFSAETTAFGRELHQADGQGVQLVCDLAPGGEDGAPERMRVFDGHVLMSATDGVIGRELFVLPTDLALVEDLGLGTNGSVLTATPPVLGSTMDVWSRNHNGADQHWLLLSSALSAPQPVPLVLPTAANWIHAPSVRLIGVFGGITFHTQIPVPSLPSLAGYEAHLQTMSLPGFTLPLSSGNGLALTLGS